VDAKALRALLSYRRGQIRPEELGLPIRARGRGRQAPGLTQEQMDELLSRSPGTYKRFESGKLRGVTPELCEEIARILRFREREWQGLWVFMFGHQPPHPLDPEAAQRIGGHWQEYVNGVTWPSYVTDQGWDVVAFNDAAAWMFPGRIMPRNTMRWMLLSADGRRQLLDWKTAWAPVVLPQLRAAVGAYPDNKTLQELDEDVHTDPVTGPMYREVREAYQQPDGDRRRMYHAGLLCPGWVQMVTSEPTGSPGARHMGLIFKEDRRIDFP
jgi:transcriptional regulator with XRE-family HTH domain